MSFRAEVAAFRKWAVDFPEDERRQYEVWEDEYRNWRPLLAAVRQFLSSTHAADWNDADIDNLVYLIARDSEAEEIADEVENSADQLLLLARAAATSVEIAAKWQLAYRLGQLEESRDDVEALLLIFVNDADEYVSRRALLTLGEIGSPHAERLAERAWASGHEYQRIAALWVLHEIRSPKFPAYLDKAFEDGRKHVVTNARKLQAL